MINCINSVQSNVYYFKNFRQKTSFKSSEENSYLKNLEKLNSNQVYDYLTDITSDDYKSADFIKEITKNPRQSRKIVKTLITKLGSKDKFDKWYYGKDGYMQAFNKYSEKFFEEAKSVEELVHFMPNWGDWKMSEKAEKTTGNRNYTLGKLPEEFGSEHDFKNLIHIIKDNFWTDHRVYGDVNVNGKHFDINYPENGLSGKIVATVNDKYIIKTSYDKKYKADSPYLNAMVDYYMNSNNCKNSIKFYYYDDETSSVLYEKSTLPECKYEVLGKSYFYSPMLVHDVFDDAKELGIRFTDRGTSNYRTDGKNNKVIDVGHAEYMDILKPGLTGYHITLPSNTGFSCTAYNGVISEL